MDPEKQIKNDNSLSKYDLGTPFGLQQREEDFKTPYDVIKKLDVKRNQCPNFQDCGNDYYLDSFPISKEESGRPEGVKYQCMVCQPEPFDFYENRAKIINKRKRIFFSYFSFISRIYRFFTASLGVFLTAAFVSIMFQGESVMVVFAREGSFTGYEIVGIGIASFIGFALLYFVLKKLDRAYMMLWSPRRLLNRARMERIVQKMLSIFEYPKIYSVEYPSDEESDRRIRDVDVFNINTQLCKRKLKSLKRE